MKISELNLAGTIAGTEVFPIVQGGETKKVTIADALAGAGGVPTLQQVTDVTDGNKTTNDIINYYDIVNNYSRLTNDFNGGGSQTPGLEIQKINGNGISKATLSVQNNNPTIDDFQDSFLYLNTNPAVGLTNQLALGSTLSVGELTQQLTFFVDTIGTFTLDWSYPSGVPRLLYNDINLGNTSSIEFSGSSIKTTFNASLSGLNLDFSNDEYYLGQVESLNNVVKVSNGIVEIYATNQIYIVSGNSGLSINNIDGITSIGDIGNENNQNQFFIDDNSSKFYTKSQGNENGLKLDFLNRFHSFGDFGVSGYGLTIDVNSAEARLFCSNVYITTGNASGFQSSGNNTYIGDIDGNGNSTTFGIDDNNRTLIGSGNLTTGNAGGNSGQHLKINIGGTDYVIQLLNP
jgi:hypothetical protein